MYMDKKTGLREKEKKRSCHHIVTSCYVPCSQIRDEAKEAANMLLGIVGLQKAHFNFFSFVHKLT